MCECPLRLALWSKCVSGFENCYNAQTKHPNIHTCCLESVFTCYQVRRLVMVGIKPPFAPVVLLSDQQIRLVLGFRVWMYVTIWVWTGCFCKKTSMHRKPNLNKSMKSKSDAYLPEYGFRALFRASCIPQFISVVHHTSSTVCSNAPTI